MKKIVFTQGQLNSLLGEDFTAYINASDNGCDFPQDSDIASNNEILTNDPIADDYPTLDKITKSEYPRNPYTINRAHKLMERNHSLDGRLFTIGKDVNDDIKELSQADNSDKLLKNIATDKNASANCWYVRLNRLKKMKNTDPERFNRINGERIIKNIEGVLDRETKITDTISKNINKTPYTKIDARKGSGKGHRNNSTFYYENK